MKEFIVARLNAKKENNDKEGSDDEYMYGNNVPVLCTEIGTTTKKYRMPFSTCTVIMYRY